MSYLIDTDVLSEAMKKRPRVDVLTWLDDHEHELYTSAITIGELRRGIERLRAGKRKAALTAWLVQLGGRMRGRVLSFNVGVAHVWGQLKAGWEKKGIIVPSIDSQIAATAHRHGLTLVTRNERHFANTGIVVLNPFRG